MMEAARTSETSVDNYFTRQYISEDKSELSKDWFEVYFQTEFYSAYILKDSNDGALGSILLF
jgi:hypothetical protein